MLAYVNVVFTVVKGTPDVSIENISKGAFKIMYYLFAIVYKTNNFSFYFMLNLRLEYTSKISISITSHGSKGKNTTRSNYEQSIKKLISFKDVCKIITLK